MLAVLVVGEAVAQSAVSGVPNAMQGFSQNRDQPIQIEAASLEDAVALAAQFPWARYGSMEVRPVADMDAERVRVGA